MTIEINPSALRKELIEIYSDYISDNEERRKEAMKKAMDLDGVWSGSFLFPAPIERALGGLTYLYVDPKLSKEKAREILEELEKLDNIKTFINIE